MSRDSGYYAFPNGNPQVDFVWGNMPMQPNDDRQGVVRPGDGESEYYLRGHATQSEYGYQAYYNVPNNGFPSELLNTGDSHVNALRSWGGFPEYVAEGGFTRTVQWYDDLVVPAALMPNIVGLKVEDALNSLRLVGVPEEFLVDALSDAENPYDWGTVTQLGAVIWRYIDPEEQIGTHWDGSPWLAKEAEGRVEYLGSWPNCPIPLTTELYGNDLPWWYTFSVIQTTDPSKNSWNWWN